MKTSTKIISLVCVVAMLFTTLAMLVSADAYTVETPVNSSMWEKPNFSTDHAYSIAFVGDTQYITCGDYYLGTEKLKYQFKYIADTAEERKLEHLFLLGDITDLGYRNDWNLAGAHNNPIITKEWEIAQEAIFQLNGKTTYSLVRGNHDDYMMDDYFNIPEYTDQFTQNGGGFYSDSEGKHPQNRAWSQERINKEGYIYWSAKTKTHHENSVVNSYMTKEICGTKYLFVTIDYNPTANVIRWLNELLPQYPDHRAIITTHSYLGGDGERIVNDDGNTMYHMGMTGEAMWQLALKKHKNVFMVVSGHTGGVQLTHSYATGDNGNTVLQVLCDPQAYDAKEINSAGKIEHGTQDTGLVLYMNFSEDGKKITFDYYSTLLQKELKGNSYTIYTEIDENGTIDMADLTEFGQTTPLVTEKKTPTLDGVATEAEYSLSRTVSKLGKGSLGCDLNEHFAYDDDYLYYAFSLDATFIREFTMNLHLGSSIFTVEELNDGSMHSRSAAIKFTDGSCKSATGNLGSYIRNDKDASCAAVVDKAAGVATYELKISREYLKANGCPDNLFGYSVSYGNMSGSIPAENYFKISNDVSNYLKELGVSKKYLWTYNYVYFGTRPEAEEPVPPAATDDPTAATTTAVTTTEAAPDVTTVGGENGGDSGEKTGGCGSSLALTAIAVMPVIGATAVLALKKRKED